MLDTAPGMMSLYTIWAARTGRVLRDAPANELTPDELIEFWADDLLEEPFGGTRVPAELPLPMHTTLLAVDVVGFGRRCPDTAAQRTVRREMYERLGRAFAATGLPWDACRREDRGDGALIVAPTGVDPVACLDRLARNLAVILHHRNRFADDGARLRLRVAVHHGYVERDAYGVFSPATSHLFRLLDAGEFKDALRTAGADLGLITSDTLYTQLFARAAPRGDGAVAPAGYRMIRVNCKEIRHAKAWLWLPSGLVTGLEDR
ncbi:hypothetical protein [Actinomadura sp. 9N215]|uniref:hypothetical protein n=1 Tax=Actinomadura sp. 9N215 TaxID=3375150 RepID=UPI00379B147A